MLGHSSKPLESDIRCFFNPNFNTGILNILQRFPAGNTHKSLDSFLVKIFWCALISPQISVLSDSMLGTIYLKTKVKKGILLLKSVLLHCPSLYWMSRIRTAQPTARQLSCTRRTSGSMRRGCLPSWNRVGVIVDPLTIHKE
jgi:hypothetical protein